MGICQTNKTEHERCRKTPIALQDDVVLNVRCFLRGYSCLFSATGNIAHVVEADVEENGWWCALDPHSKDSSSGSMLVF